MGSNPCQGWTRIVAVEIERQLDYIPGDDRDDGVQSRGCDLGAGPSRQRGPAPPLKSADSGPLPIPSRGAGQRPFLFDRHPRIRVGNSAGALTLYRHLSILRCGPFSHRAFARQQIMGDCAFLFA